MIRKDILNCSIFGEFSKDEQEYFFGATGKKVLHNVDTLYYGVSFVETIGNIDSFIADLRALRDLEEDSDNPKSFMDLEYRACSFAHYRHCLSLKDSFDIFIAEFLPNKDTPRIVVQLRSISLWADGDKGALNKSYKYLKPIIEKYGLKLLRIRENRIDWAFHTNNIQNADSFLTDDMLMRNLKSNLTKYQKVGNIGKKISVEYLSLGMRKSNNVFFRAYNKTREVVEMGYKSIFIEVWYNNKLISRYDKEVLETAYIFGSKQGFESAVAIGKIDWYLKHGKNENTKAFLTDLRQKYLVDSSNMSHLNDELNGVLPDITSIMNFEFQTKRRYYRMMEKSINSLPIKRKNNRVNVFDNLYLILDNRKLFLDKLTSETVCFVKDRNDKLEEILKGNTFLDFWKRIRSCKTPVTCDVELYRTYIRNIDKERAAKGIADKVATLSVLNRKGDNDFDFDLADALCYFNDNDICNILAVDENGEIKNDFDFKNYDILKGRKRRQYKFLEDSESAEAISGEEISPK